MTEPRIGWPSIGYTIRDCLSEDLLKPEYRGSEVPYYGHCYVASEALYHFEKERHPTLAPYYAKDSRGNTHWWLQFFDRRGRLTIWDLTADQYPFRGAPYYQGKGRRAAFLTKTPSKRAVELMARCNCRTNPERVFVVYTLCNHGETS
jgi:hypothetical protein